MQSPFGYDRKNGKLVENPDEIRTIGKVKKWWAEGTSNDDIAERLNFAGVRAKRGGLWYGPSVNDLLYRLRSQNEF